MGLKNTLFHRTQAVKEFFQKFQIFLTWLLHRRISKDVFCCILFWYVINLFCFIFGQKKGPYS